MQIAIIGSGIAGLSAAWLLSRKYRVTLFERHASPGMGAHNLDYHWQDRSVRIDVPLRAFNPCHYRNLVPFYQHLGIELRRTDHSAAYSRPGEPHPYFAYRYLDVGDYAIPRLADWRQWRWDSLRVGAAMARFLWQARRERELGRLDPLTIEAYLDSRGFPAVFKEQVLLPSFAAIGTCSHAAIRQYPATAIVDFMTSGMLFNGIWRVKAGAEEAIRRMLEPCHKLVCNALVTSLTRPRDGSDARITLQGPYGELGTFDRVVLATQAHQARRLLTHLDDTPMVQDWLATVPHERSEVVVHGDTRLAPGFGKHSPPVLFELDAHADKPMASIHLNGLYPELAEAPPLFQTWNPLREPDPATIVGRAHFERPLVTLESQAAMRRLRDWQSNPARPIFLVGSYVAPGIPLLESGLQSAMQVAATLGVTPPWQAL